jgi:threonine/homoserine/homoserine lactone efflux protein
MGGLYHIGRPYAFVTFMHILMSFIEKRKSLQLLYQFLVEPLEFLLIGCCLGFAYSMGSLRKEM